MEVFVQFVGLHLFVDLFMRIYWTYTCLFRELNCIGITSMFTWHIHSNFLNNRQLYPFEANSAHIYFNCVNNIQICWFDYGLKRILNSNLFAINKSTTIQPPIAHAVAAERRQETIHTNIVCLGQSFYRVIVEPWRIWATKSCGVSKGTIDRLVQEICWTISYCSEADLLSHYYYRLPCWWWCCCWLSEKGTANRVRTNG